MHDISFAGLRRPHSRIPRAPAGPQAQAARPSLLLHGSGGDRSDLLVDGRLDRRPRRGGDDDHRAVLVDAGRPRAPPGPRCASRSELAVDDVVAARRAVDVLRSLPQVDPKRIGLLGWSAGARTGAVLAGAEPRLKAFVLMSAGALPVSQYAAAAPASLRPAVRRTLTPIDPLRWIARGRPGHDLPPGRPPGRRRAAAGRSPRSRTRRPPGTRLRWYAAGHPLNIPAEHDQLAWLAQKLGIQGPAVPGAASARSRRPVPGAASTTSDASTRVPTTPAHRQTSGEIHTCLCRDRAECVPLRPRAGRRGAAPVAWPQMPPHRADQRTLDVLAARFGFAAFRPGQQRVVEALLAGPLGARGLPDRRGQEPLLPAARAAARRRHGRRLAADRADEGPDRLPRRAQGIDAARLDSSLGPDEFARRRRSACARAR